MQTSATPGNWIDRAMLRLLNLLLLLAGSADAARGSQKMVCGSGVNVCGVLTLESGFGTGYYKHDGPAVHGLWPEVSPYGSSACVAPIDSTDPGKVYSCYSTDSGGKPFENHEWEKHGVCAGVQVS